MPCDIATLATDMPGSSHCGSTIALNCDLYRRLVCPLLLAIVSTYSYVDTILQTSGPSFKMTWPGRSSGPRSYRRLLYNAPLCNNSGARNEDGDRVGLGLHTVGFEVDAACG